MNKRMIGGCLTAALIGFSLTLHAQSEPAQGQPAPAQPGEPEQQAPQKEAAKRFMNKKHMVVTPKLYASIQADGAKTDKIRIMEYAEEQRAIDQLRAKLDELQRMADQQMIRSIIEDMRADKIIDGDKDLWFSLTADKMIVNGKKQPSRLHKKYANRFIPKPGSGIFYGNPPEN